MIYFYEIQIQTITTTTKPKKKCLSNILLQLNKIKMTRIDLMVSFERQLDQRENSLHASANVMIIEKILHQSIQFHQYKL